MANNTAAEAGLVHASLEFISNGLRDYRDAASALGRYSKGNESVNDEIGAVLLEHTIFTNTMLEIFEASLPNNRDQWQDAGTAVKARANLGMSYGRYTDSIGIMLEDVKKLAKLAQLDENEETIKLAVAITLIYGFVYTNTRKGAMAPVEPSAKTPPGG